jgi:hypothetical protein
MSHMNYISVPKYVRHSEAGNFAVLYLPPLQLLNQLTDFHEIWYGRCAITGHIKVVLFSFLQSVITVWLTHKLARWVQHQLHLK